MWWSATNLPTTIVTALPCLAFAPPRGVWLITIPFLLWSVTFWVSRVTVKPAPVSVLVAFARRVADDRRHGDGRRRLGDHDR